MGDFRLSNKKGKVALNKSYQNLLQLQMQSIPPFQPWKSQEGRCRKAPSPEFTERRGVVSIDGAALADEATFSHRDALGTTPADRRLRGTGR